MANTRLFAVKALLDILNKRHKPKQSIENVSLTLDRRDRAFIMEIVYGVLRFRDTLDWILKHFLIKPSKLGNYTLNNLRIALYQIYFMRVPDWAVVNESVEIEKGKKAGRPSLVNAVLRNILRQKNRFTLPFNFDDPVLDISVNASHPKWLVKRWMKRFGKEEAALLAMANNEIPPMTIRVNRLRIKREQLLNRLLENGLNSEITSFSPDGIVLKDMHEYNSLSFIHGLFTVQDEASQLISYLLDPKPGERILDVCAAPGGKTTHIAQIMQDSGDIIALEKDPRRVNMLHENIRDLGINSVNIINDDITKLKNPGTFDKILVDAPCSAIGVIRRNPDVKYMHKAKDLIEFRSKQLRLLRAASNFLRKDGTIVYSICSTEQEEGEEVVNEFLKNEREFRIILENNNIFLRHFINNGFFRTYPHKHNMDGFFGVSFCRQK